MTTTPTVQPPPTPIEFFIDHPLYEKIIFKSDEDLAANSIFRYLGPLDAYCPRCESHSIFVRTKPFSLKRDREPNWLEMQSFDVVFTCSRNASHQMLFMVKVNNKTRTMQKVGQYPSLADLNMYDVKKYRGLLDKATFQELTKAIGLAAHGVGIGSFVYLRRTFENLVEEAHQAAQTDRAGWVGSESWDEEAYQAARMSEKIQILKEYLPEFLVENRVIYGILSKGIHELSENECLAAFPAVKVGIEIILDGNLEQAARRKKLDAARTSIQAIASANDKNA